jgi:Na+-driven multidrug efflux pump
MGRSTSTSRVSARGIIIGAFADVLAAVVLGVPFSLYTLSQIDPGHHLATGQLAAASTAAIHAHPLVRAAELLTGLLAAVFGGYTAGLFAKHDEVLNGALSCWLSLVLGSFTLVLGNSPDSFAITFLMLIASPFCGMLGGYLRIRRKESLAQVA